MTDFEVAYQITDTIELFFHGFSVLATLIFAYVTGAFYFLHRAPMITKIVSFAFLISSVSFLMINSVGTYFHFLAVIDQLEVQAARADVSQLVASAHDGRTRFLAQAGFWSFVPVVLGTLVMCFWMTFIWRPKPDQS